MSKTQELRDECERRGIEYTCGLVMGESKRRVNTENVTTLWDGTDAGKSLTFEEDESGALWCADEMSVSQCIGAYLAGMERDDD
jgi:hypothetical protein